MSALLLQHEPAVRLGVFGCIFLVMGLSEIMSPRRGVTRGRRCRWRANLGLAVAGTALVRLLLPLAGVGGALWAQTHGFGFFNRMAAPLWLSLPLSLVVLDTLIYGQHVMFHRVGFLWRFHKVHHADADLDVTTALRFHPLEILASMLVKMAAAALIGAPAVAVLVFEVVLNATAMFNHANVRLRPAIERGLRFLMVTPDMHLVHHSTRKDEQMRNFGFNLSLWDRLFGTYLERSADGPAMRIGLAEHDGAETASLLWNLGLPFFTARPAERA